MKPFSPSSPTPSNRRVLRWYLPPVVRTYEQIAQVLAERGEKNVTPSEVRSVCESVSLKLRLGPQSSR